MASILNLHLAEPVAEVKRGRGRPALTPEERERRAASAAEPTEELNVVDQALAAFKHGPG